MRSRRKDERLVEKLSPYFDLVDQHEHRVTLSLGHKEVAEAVAMGPSAWHIDVNGVAARVATLPDPMPVTASVSLWTFQPASR